MRVKGRNVNMWQRTQASQGQTNSLLTGNILSERGDWQPNGIISLLVFLLSSIYATFTLTLSPLPSSSRSALIQLCICILNDSITRDPAVKITDVCHYFSPLGHCDPQLQGSNNSHSPLFSPSLSIHLSYFLPISLSHTPPINILLPFCDWEEIIAKWFCLCALGMASWQKSVFLVIFLLWPHNKLQKRVWWHTKLFKPKEQWKRNKIVSVGGCCKGHNILFFLMHSKPSSVATAL